MTIGVQAAVRNYSFDTLINIPAVITKIIYIKNNTRDIPQLLFLKKIIMRLFVIPEDEYSDILHSSNQFKEILSRK